jgi:selenide, water dikinase
VLDGALDAIRLGCIPGGLLANREFAECVVNVQNSNIADDVRTLLFDPQTAGGLLISVRAEHADALTKELRAAGYPNTCRIGEVLAGRPAIGLI